MIYADYNATTPLLPEVIDAMGRIQSERWANASSAHQAGRLARGELEKARMSLADELKASPNQVVFTSGGTESNNWIIQAAACCDKRHLITSSVEHPSILRPSQLAGKRGSQVTLIKVNRQGDLDREAYANALKNSPTLVSMMWANNETGYVFPIEELAQEAKEAGAFFHCDASQWVGKMPVNFQDSACDFMTVSAHKFYGPKGVGALLVKDRKPLEHFACGGGQEFGMRPGTENVAAIVGMATALKCLQSDAYEKQKNEIHKFRDMFEAKLAKSIDGIVINCGPESGALRLPNTSNVLFKGLDGQSLLMNLDLEGVCVSTASACHSGSVKPSHVLLEMGLKDEEASASIRFSFGLFTTEAEIDQLVSTLSEAVPRLRGE